MVTLCKGKMATLKESKLFIERMKNKTLKIQEKEEDKLTKRQRKKNRVRPEHTQTKPISGNRPPETRTGVVGRGRRCGHLGGSSVKQEMKMLTF